MDYPITKMDRDARFKAVADVRGSYVTKAIGPLSALSFAFFDVTMEQQLTDDQMMDLLETVEAFLGSEGSRTLPLAPSLRLGRSPEYEWDTLALMVNVVALQILADRHPKSIATYAPQTTQSTAYLKARAAYLAQRMPELMVRVHPEIEFTLPTPPWPNHDAQ